MATAGSVYKVAVAGFNGAAGSFTVAVSQAPVAVDDARTVAEDSGATNLQVLANDTDAEGDPIEITGVADPQHGTATVVQGAQGAPDQISYTPDADYRNDPGPAPTDDFAYTVVGGASATVAVTATMRAGRRRRARRRRHGARGRGRGAAGGARQRQRRRG